MSRQAEYQQRQRAAGLCIYCPKPQGPHRGYCDEHYERHMARRAKSRGRQQARRRSILEAIEAIRLSAARRGRR